MVYLVTLEMKESKALNLNLPNDIYDTKDLMSILMHYQKNDQN